MAGRVMMKSAGENIKKIRTSDLRVGMFVHKAESPWLSTPFMFDGYEVASQKEIQTLLDYDIQTVYIDVARGMDVGEAPRPAPQAETRQVKAMETFTVSFSDFHLANEAPVDIYWKGADGEFKMALKKGLTISEEVSELFRERGIEKVNVPDSQKPLYEAYMRRIESLREKQKIEGFADAFVDPRKVEAHYNFMNDYHPISPFVLVPGSKAGFDIFLRKMSYINISHKSGDKLEAGKIDSWKHGDSNLLIRAGKEAVDAYQAYMMEHTQKSHDPKARSSFVRENSKLIVESLARNPRSEELMKATSQSVTDLTDVVMNNPTTFYGLMKINNYDYYTFTHSVNVATLSIALAMAAGITDKEELADLGLGSILHDLGKSKVESNLINKPGKLTDIEYVKVKNHVILGYEMLQGNKSIPERALLPLLQHHEKLTGNGYPNKLASDKIHIFGRIAGIIDIYDALTTERTYKKAFRPFDALTLITKTEGEFDKELIAIFIKLIHKQEK
jgi:HD-GYP domain-containing protein (c-di-GMP phosphodiesterase class II)